MFSVRLGGQDTQCTCFSPREPVIWSDRLQQDIDIVVLTSIWTQEELKQRMIAANPSFYTVKSVNPMATYRLLFYRLPGYRRSCKVDLLVPGIMNIPSVPTKHITYVYPEMGMPLMPFLPLLLLKLQAWQDHGESHRQYMKDKQPVDVQDIMELLNLAMTSRKVGRLDLGKEKDWLPETFVDAGKSRVKRYVKLYPTTAKQWKYIGF